jgi:hypothetical protein
MSCRRRAVPATSIMRLGASTRRGRVSRRRNPPLCGRCLSILVSCFSLRSGAAHLLVEDLKLIGKPRGREAMGINTPFVSRLKAIRHSLDLASQLRKTPRSPGNLPEITNIAKRGCLAHAIKFFAVFRQYIAVYGSFAEQNASCLTNGDARHMMAVHRQIPSVRCPCPVDIIGS